MSKGPAAKLWQDVKKGLKDAHLVRIESRVGLGIPDVNGCIDGKEFWLELMVIKGNSLRLSKFQKAWIYERTKSGGKVFVLARPLRGSVLKVFEGSNAIQGPDSRYPVLWIHDPGDWLKFYRLLGPAGEPDPKIPFPLSSNSIN